MNTTAPRKKQRSLQGGFAKGYLQIAVVLVIVCGAFYFSQAPSPEEVIERQALVMPQRNKEKKAVVSVIKPQVRSHTIKVSTTGTIVVRNPVELVPQVSGRITWVDPNFRRGGMFQAGQKVIQIDATDFELALAQVEAEMQNAKANLRLAQANSEAAIANYALLNPDKEVPPLVAKTPQIEQAKAQVAAAAAKLDIAQLNLSRAEFVLPFSGRVVDSSAEIGQLLNQGQSFGSVYAVDSVEALVPIAPDQLQLIEPAVGRKALINLGDEQYAAEVVRVSPDLDERTRFAQLFLKLDQTSGLLPGAFVEIAINGPEVVDALVLPDAAEQANQSVWLVKEGRLKKWQPNLIARERDGLIAEAFDMASGVVMGAVPGGREGMPVTIAGGEQISVAH